MVGELREEPLTHSSTGRLCWDRLQPQRWSCLPPIRPMVQAPGQAGTFLDPQFSQWQAMVFPYGHYHFMPGLNPSGPAHGKRPSNPFEPTLERPTKRLRYNSCHPRRENCTPMVDSKGKRHVRHTSSTSSPHHRDLDRRQHSRVRWKFAHQRSTRKSRHVRSVDSRPSPVSHKLPGTQGCRTGSTSLGTSSDKPVLSPTHRQHNSSQLHKQTVRFAEPCVTQTLPGYPRVVPQSECNSESSAYQGVPEHPQRLSQSQRNSDSYRMVHTSFCSDHHQAHLDRTATDRPICYQVEQQTASVYLPSGRSTGVKDALDRVRGICLSTPSHTVPSSEQNRTDFVSHLSHSTQLAPDGVVPALTELARGHSQEDTTHEQFTQTTTHSNLPSKSFTFGSTRVQTLQRCLQIRGFSQTSARNISTKNRDSSELCYDKYWSRYLDWCKRKSIDPLLATVTELADFLSDLVDTRDVVPCTLDGIKSCVLITLKFCTGIDLTKNCELSAITAKYHKDCPAEVFKVPSWNLVLVLEMLCKPPFEPLTNASFKHLTFKCVFLTAMACSCRVSELHAIAFDKLSHTKDWSVVYLEPRSDFLAKNQDSRSVTHTRQFKLKALVPPANKTKFVPHSFQEAAYNRKKLFCPVRALRFYLARTERRRHGKASLFVSLQPNRRKDITKQSVANWVRRTIKMCYALAGENDQNLGQASVHEIRALTASVKFDRNLSLDSIMKSCVWKNQNTFTKYYLRNVAVLSQDLHKFPPMWMSQSQVN